MSFPTEIKDDGEHAVKEAANSAVEFISERPLASVGVAAALGFIIAWILF